ncbi:type II toxin-antitoxin system RelE/ParE family toxin [Aquifex sp.]
MRQLEVHEQFIKDLNKVKLKNKQHMQKLFTYVSLLLNEKPLPPEAKDHSLKGNFKDIREFHLRGDIIVLYRKDENKIQLLRIGSHAQVLGM